MLQASLKNEDQSDLSLIFGNRTVNDILLKEELEQLQKGNERHFKLHLTVDIAPPADSDWKGSTGFMTKDMI